jgi:hypothetical protein
VCVISLLSVSFYLMYSGARQPCPTDRNYCSVSTALRPRVLFPYCGLC